MKRRLFDIIHEDEALLIVNKAPMVLSIPDRFDPEKPNLQRLLEIDREKVWIVHRLDFETSGILCFAKTEEAHKHLSQQFEKRTVEKYYQALVDGQLRPETGTIDQPIGSSAAGGGRMIVTRKGKPSVTRYKVLEHFKSFSLVEIQILTGRTHQIRVHFQHIGFPLMVDRRYGSREAFYLSSIKQRRYNLKKDQEERPLVTRTTLHAHKLTLRHPTTDAPQTFEAPLPKDMAAAVKQLRKWGM
jgi:23S rRNA pseudouridine1911/1915/1917 synthase